MKIQGKVILDDDHCHWVYNIPNDIIGEILLRLPAKSLLRFRWACKYWFDLISRDSSFVKMHLHHSTITTNNNHHNYDKDEILMRRRRRVSSSSIVLSIGERNGVDDSDKLLQRSLDYNDATGVVDLSSEVNIALPFDRPAGCDLLIMGSCNGLILLLLCQGLDEIFCIWNPCTKEYIILPLPLGMFGLPPPFHFGFGSPRSHLCYGFGYDHTTDDYKVIIRNMYCTFGNGCFGPVLSEVQVYTLGTNSWRKVIDDGPNLDRTFLEYRTEGLFVNGAIYWINDYGDIFSFDIGKEKFRDVSKIPNLIDHRHLWTNVSMREFEGSLCVVINDHLDCHKEIWVMKQEYAVNNNNNNNNNEYLWTKLSAIPHLDDCHLRPLNPLRFTRNGEILMVTNEHYLRLYDPKNSNVETICRICEYPDRCDFTDVYTGSLVSLNSRTYMGRERMKQTKKKKKKKNQINKEQEHA